MMLQLTRSGVTAMIPTIRVLLITGSLIGAGVAHANDHVRVKKAQGSAWTFLPLDIGVEQGLFAKRLDIESADLGGDAKVQQALAAGSIDFGLGSGPGMAFSAKGSPAIAVAAFAGPPRNISAIVLHNSAIEKIADLKGKLIAVSTGSLRLAGQQMAFRKAGARIAFAPCHWAPSRPASPPSRPNRSMPWCWRPKQASGSRSRRKGVLATVDRYAPHFITHVVFAQKSLVASNRAWLRASCRASLPRSRSWTHKETSSLAERVLGRARAWRAGSTTSRPGCSAMTGVSGARIATLKQSFIDMKMLQSVPADAELFTTQFVPVKQ
jgi:hypothetical protein